MRIIDGIWAPPKPHADDRIKTADLWVGDRLLTRIGYNVKVGFIWTSPPGAGSIIARQGDGRVRVTGGAQALYNGRWPEEAKAMWRFLW